MTVRNRSGGISIRSPTAVTNVTFSGFSYVGFWNLGNIVGQATVTGSTFTGNLYGLDQKPGGLHAAGASLTVTNSTFSANDYGIGIFVTSDQPSSMTVTNSTFTGNKTGLDNAPAGPHPLSVTNSTFTGNTIVGFIHETRTNNPDQGQGRRPSPVRRSRTMPPASSINLSVSMNH